MIYNHDYQKIILACLISNPNLFDELYTQNCFFTDRYIEVLNKITMSIKKWNY